MKKELTIGREASNDIVVNQSIISRIHAKVTYIDEEKIQIEDLGSANHTFVNGEKIKNKIISPSDRVTLGSYPLDTKSIFKSLNKIVNEHKTDFRSEFAQLKIKHDDFERQVDRLQKGTQSKPMYIRAGFTVAAMVISFFLLNDTKLQYPVMMGAGLIGGILSVSSKGNSKMKDEIDDLSVKLQREYKCPKCSMSLMGKRWNYWAGLGSCPQCHARWMD